MKKIFTFVLLTASFSLIAQTGPGGVGNSSNNVVWLDGDIVTTGTHPDIATWPDQSGNGNDFSQGSSTRQPRIVTYSGFNGVRFDGGDWLRTGGIAALNTNTNTQYIIYNGYRPNHLGMLYEGSYTQSSQFFRTFRVYGNVRSWVLNNTGGVVDNVTSQSSAFQIVSSVWDGNTQNYSSYKDGALIGSKTGANGNPTGNSLNTIGAASNNAYRFDGDMGEVIIYNVALNSAQRNIVDNYLSSKFNTAIVNDMYAYDSGLTHRFGVIGIGQEADGNNLVAQGRGIVQLSAASLNNGDYVFSGHNNVGLSNFTNDVPASIAGGTRLARTWRADVTGVTNIIDVAYDVSGLTLPGTGGYYLLVESNNGVFNDGGVVSYGPFSDVGGIVTFTGVTLADGDYYTLASGASAGIVSVKTGGWNTASTWNCNCIPGVSDDVTISFGHTVTATTTTNVNDLIIDGTLNTLQTGDFNIKGDLVVNATGSFVSKTIRFNGAAAQNMTNNSATIVDFSTLIISNSNGVNVQSGSFRIVNSILVPNGPLNNIGGIFILRSNASGTAVILNSSGGFTGTFIVQRHVSQRNAGWGDLSSPVSNATLGEWDSDPSGTVTEIYMSGVGGVDGNAISFQSVYYYDENTQSFVTVTDTTQALSIGRGFEIWLEDSNSVWEAKTFDTRGTPNFGNIAMPVANSWNLVGNPYQSWIKWTELSKPTLNGTFYIWNTNNGTYDASTTGLIPPNQGFWVESVGAGTLTFMESSKTGSGSSTFYRTNGELAEEPFVFTEAQLKVKSKKSPYNHTLKLRLNNLATLNYDYHDGSFLPSRVLEAPSITSYSVNNNKKLAINSFNYNDEIVLPIAVEVGVSGNYIIEAINFDEFAHEYKVMELTDTKTGKVYDLTSINEVEVLIDEYETGERFSLRLSNQATNTVNGMDQQIAIYKANEVTVIEFDDVEQNYVVSVYNALGQKIIEDQMVSNINRFELQNSLIDKGLVIIKVNSSKGEIVQKLTY
jgi:hypothetical protein|tara:strand:+ start:53765 stop:56758 length:2994 start_codon:yes stop_codon:yes gene_type:complete